MSQKNIRHAALSKALSFPSMSAIKPISTEQCENMKAHNVHKNPVPCERLRIVSFLLINFAGQQDKGQVVVLDAVAERAQIIFDTLYKQRFPINKVLLMETYNGDDNASMNDNNTSALNGRPITGGSEWSARLWCRY